LALPLIGSVGWAAGMIKHSLSISTLVAILIVSVGGVGGVGTGVALTGVVRPEYFDRVLKADNFMSGVVSDRRTGGVVKSRIDVFKADSACCVSVAEAFTKDDGRYEVQLPPGRYRVLFVPFDRNASVSGEWWKDADTFEVGSIVTIPGGGANINAGLRPRFRVDGRVTSAATTLPIPKMGVSATFGLNGASQNRPVARAETDADGRYALQLPAGTYFLYFTALGYVPSVWRDARVADGVANTITVIDRDLRNIDQVVPAPQR
jgi:hypothetical protein